MHISEKWNTVSLTVLFMCLKHPLNRGKSHISQTNIQMSSFLSLRKVHHNSEFSHLSALHIQNKNPLSSKLRILFVMRKN